MKLEKMTETARVAEKRWYDDACGTALAMELVGERWSLLIVRELMFGPRRFGELRAGLPGISANVLTQRLAGMEQVGILARRKLPPPASVQVYELTEWGYRSEVAIQELGRWAVQSPLHDATLPFSAASAMLSFRTMIDRTRSDAEIAMRRQAASARRELVATPVPPFAEIYRLLGGLQEPRRAVVSVPRQASGFFSLVGRLGVARQSG